MTLNRVGWWLLPVLVAFTVFFLIEGLWVPALLGVGWIVLGAVGRYQSRDRPTVRRVDRRLVAVVCVAALVGFVAGATRAGATTVPEVRAAISVLGKDIHKLWAESKGRRVLYRTECVAMREHGVALAAMEKPAEVGRDFWNAATTAGREWSLVAESCVQLNQALLFQHLGAASKACREARRADPTLGRLFGKHAFDAGVPSQKNLPA